MEIRQQLSILQAEIQNMQPTPQPTVQPNNIVATINAQLVGYGGTIWGTLDLKSLLSKGLQALPWPTTYKPIALPKFNGKEDLR